MKIGFKCVKTEIFIRFFTNELLKVEKIFKFFKCSSNCANEVRKYLKYSKFENWGIYHTLARRKIQQVKT